MERTRTAPSPAIGWSDLPPELELRESSIQPGKTGLWSKGPIGVGRVYGPFLGQTVNVKPSKVTDCTIWQIRDVITRRVLHYVDASRPGRQNWMRHLKCSPFIYQRNVEPFQKGLQIYYKVVKELSSGEELITYLDESPLRIENDNQERAAPVDGPSSGWNPVLLIRRVNNNSSSGSKKTLQVEFKSGPPQVPLSLVSSHNKRNPSSSTASASSSKTGSRSSRPDREVDDAKSNDLAPVDLLVQEVLATKINVNDMVLDDANKSSSSTSTDKRSILKKNTPTRAAAVAASVATSHLASGSGSGTKNSSTTMPQAQHNTRGPGSGKKGMKGQQKTTPVASSATSSSSMSTSTSTNTSTAAPPVCPPSPPVVDQETNEYQFHIRDRHIIESNRHGKKVYRCDVCAGVYRHAFSLKRHYIRTHINYNYLSSADIANCNITLTHRTPKRVMSDQELKRSGKKREWRYLDLYRCHLCQNHFCSSALLINHINNHPDSPAQKRFPCSQCEMTFSHKQNLVRHESVHSGVKPHACRYCNKNFPSAANQRRHERIHEGLKPFDCRDCDSAFSQSGDLRKHVRKQHNSRYNPCNLCAKYFPTIELLQAHQEMHQMEQLSVPLTTEAGFRFGNAFPGPSRSTTHHPNSGFNYDVVNGTNALPSSVVASNAGKYQATECICTECPKKFSTYVNMCRHRRLAHHVIQGRRGKFIGSTSNGAAVNNGSGALSSRDSRFGAGAHLYGSAQPAPDAPITETEFLMTVAQRINNNLMDYVDGKDYQLKYRPKKDVTIPTMAYSSSNGESSNTAKPPVWKVYNFPRNFDMSTLSNPNNNVCVSESNGQTIHKGYSGTYAVRDAGNLLRQYGLKVDENAYYNNWSNEMTSSEEYDDSSTTDEDEPVRIGRDLVPVTYVCSACGESFDSNVGIEEHKINNHPNVYCTHIEIEGAKAAPPELSLQYRSPVGFLRQCPVPPLTSDPVSDDGDSRLTCTKCGSAFEAVADLHLHILECGGDAEFVRQKAKFNATYSRRRGRPVKRQDPNDPLTKPSKIRKISNDENNAIHHSEILDKSTPNKEIDKEATTPIPKPKENGKSKNKAVEPVSSTPPPTTSKNSSKAKDNSNKHTNAKSTTPKDLSTKSRETPSSKSTGSSTSTSKSTSKETSPKGNGAGSAKETRSSTQPRSGSSSSGSVKVSETISKLTIIRDHKIKMEELALVIPNVTLCEGCNTSLSLGDEFDHHSKICPALIKLRNKDDSSDSNMPPAIDEAAALVATTALATSVMASPVANKNNNGKFSTSPKEITNKTLTTTAVTPSDSSVVNVSVSSVQNSSVVSTGKSVASPPVANVNESAKNLDKTDSPVAAVNTSTGSPLPSTPLSRNTCHQCFKTFSTPYNAKKHIREVCNKRLKLGLITPRDTPVKVKPPSPPPAPPLLAATVSTPATPPPPQSPPAVPATVIEPTPKIPTPEEPVQIQAPITVEEIKREPSPQAKKYKKTKGRIEKGRTGKKILKVKVGAPKMLAKKQMEKVSEEKTVTPTPEEKISLNLSAIIDDVASNIPESPKTRSKDVPDQSAEPVVVKSQTEPVLPPVTTIWSKLAADLNPESDKNDESDVKPFQPETSVATSRKARKCAPRPPKFTPPVTPKPGLTTPQPYMILNPLVNFETPEKEKNKSIDKDEDIDDDVPLSSLRGAVVNKEEDAAEKSSSSCTSSPSLLANFTPVRETRSKVAKNASKVEEVMSQQPKDEVTNETGKKSTGSTKEDESNKTPSSSTTKLPNASDLKEKVKPTSSKKSGKGVAAKNSSIKVSDSEKVEEISTASKRTSARKEAAKLASSSEVAPKTKDIAKEGAKKNESTGPTTTETTSTSSGSNDASTTITPAAETTEKSSPSSETTGKSNLVTETAGKTSTTNKTPGKTSPNTENTGKTSPNAETHGKSNPSVETSGKTSPNADIIFIEHNVSSSVIGTSSTGIDTTGVPNKSTGNSSTTGTDEVTVLKSNTDVTSSGNVKETGDDPFKFRSNTPQGEGAQGTSVSDASLSMDNRDLLAQVPIKREKRGESFETENNKTDEDPDNPEAPMEGVGKRVMVKRKVKTEFDESKFIPQQLHKCPQCLRKFSYLANYRKHMYDGCPLSRIRKELKKKIRPVVVTPSVLKSQIEDLVIDLLREHHPVDVMKRITTPTTSTTPPTTSTTTTTTSSSTTSTPTGSKSKKSSQSKTLAGSDTPSTSSSTTPVLTSKETSSIGNPVKTSTPKTKLETSSTDGSPKLTSVKTKSKTKTPKTITLDTTTDTSTPSLGVATKPEVAKKKKPKEPLSIPPPTVTNILTALSKKLKNSPTPPLSILDEVIKPISKVSLVSDNVTSPKEDTPVELIPNVDTQLLPKVPAVKTRTKAGLAKVKITPCRADTKVVVNEDMYMNKVSTPVTDIKTSTSTPTSSTSASVNSVATPNDLDETKSAQTSGSPGSDNVQQNTSDLSSPSIQAGGNASASGSGSKFTSFSCNFCNKIFLSYWKLLQHRISHKLESGNDNQSAIITTEDAIINDFNKLSEKQRVDTPTSSISVPALTLPDEPSINKLRTNLALNFSKELPIKTDSELFDEMLNEDANKRNIALAASNANQGTPEVKPSKPKSNDSSPKKPSPPPLYSSLSKRFATSTVDPDVSDPEVLDESKQPEAEVQKSNQMPPTEIEENDNKVKGVAVQKVTAEEKKAKKQGVKTKKTKSKGLQDQSSAAKGKSPRLKPLDIADKKSKVKKTKVDPAMVESAVLDDQKTSEEVKVDDEKTVQEVIKDLLASEKKDVDDEQTTGKSPTTKEVQGQSLELEPPVKEVTVVAVQSEKVDVEPPNEGTSKDTAVEIKKTKKVGATQNKKANVEDRTLTELEPKNEDTPVQSKKVKSKKVKVDNERQSTKEEEVVVQTKEDAVVEIESAQVEVKKTRKRSIKDSSVDETVEHEDCKNKEDIPVENETVPEVETKKTGTSEGCKIDKDEVDVQPLKEQETAKVESIVQNEQVEVLDLKATVEVDDNKTKENNEKVEVEVPQRSENAESEVKKVGKSPSKKSKVAEKQTTKDNEIPPIETTEVEVKKTAEEKVEVELAKTKQDEVSNENIESEVKKARKNGSPSKKAKGVEKQTIENREVEVGKMVEVKKEVEVSETEQDLVPNENIESVVEKVKKSASPSKKAKVAEKDVEVQPTQNTDVEVEKMVKVKAEVAQTQQDIVPNENKECDVMKIRKSKSPSTKAKVTKKLTMDVEVKNSKIKVGAQKKKMESPAGQIKKAKLFAEEVDVPVPTTEKVDVTPVELTKGAPSDDLEGKLRNELETSTPKIDSVPMKKTVTSVLENLTTPKDNAKRVLDEKSALVKTDQLELECEKVDVETPLREQDRLELQISMGVQLEVRAGSIKDIGETGSAVSVQSDEEDIEESIPSTLHQLDHDTLSIPLSVSVSEIFDGMNEPPPSSSLDRERRRANSEMSRSSSELDVTNLDTSSSSASNTLAINTAKSLQSPSKTKANGNPKTSVKVVQQPKKKKKPVARFKVNVATNKIIKSSKTRSGLKLRKNLATKLKKTFKKSTTVKLKSQPEMEQEDVEVEVDDDELPAEDKKKCHKCDRVFASKFNRNRHYQQAHSKRKSNKKLTTVKGASKRKRDEVKPGMDQINDQSHRVVATTSSAKKIKIESQTGGKTSSR